MLAAVMQDGDVLQYAHPQCRDTETGGWKGRRLGIAPLGGGGAFGFGAE